MNNNFKHGIALFVLFGIGVGIGYLSIQMFYKEPYESINSNLYSSSLVNNMTTGCRTAQCGFGDIPWSGNYIPYVGDTSNANVNDVSKFFN